MTTELKEQLKRKIDIFTEKMGEMEVNSVKHIQYSSIRRDLRDRLQQLTQESKKEAPKMKVHVDPNDTICEACQ